MVLLNDDIYQQLNVGLPTINDERPDYVFLAETTNDVLCYDGGVKAFLETDNMDAILYLDKCLWDQYSDVLTGHVILKDAEYYVLSKHLYGE